EILGEDRGVLTPVNNEELFVSELEILVTDSEKRRELGSNLKQYVASTFTKTAMFQKTKELYFGN
ncbi:hypothetical protein CL644_01475, partial [bacterium]|nr:hypothetical protein [bacterium]